MWRGMSYEAPRWRVHMRDRLKRIKPLPSYKARRRIRTLTRAVGAMRRSQDDLEAKFDLWRQERRAVVSEPRAAGR
jgi:hypothetical protein